MKQSLQVVNTEPDQQTGNVLTIIKRRRSIGKLTSQMPTRRQIEYLLEAGVCAPNHHRVEPWRFFVLTGQAQNELGRALDHHKEKSKFSRAPVVIVVASVYPERSKVLDVENLEATAAAVQNMLLAAEEIGLSCIWRTKDPAYDPRVKRWLGLAKEDHIVALIDVGFAAKPGSKERHRSFADKTVWLGWKDEED